MKLQEIAARIDAHLKRFEKDPTINHRERKYGVTPYWNTRAGVAGSRKKSTD